MCKERWRLWKETGSLPYYREMSELEIAMLKAARDD